MNKRVFLIEGLCAVFLIGTGLSTSALAQSSPPTSYDPGPSGTYSAGYRISDPLSDNVFCLNAPGEHIMRNQAPVGSPYYKEVTLRPEHWDVKLSIISSIQGGGSGSVQLPGLGLWQIYQTPNPVTSGDGASGSWNGIEGSGGGTILPDSTFTPSGYYSCPALIIIQLAAKFVHQNNYVYAFQTRYDFIYPSDSSLTRQTKYSTIYSGILTRDATP